MYSHLRENKVFERITALHKNKIENHKEAEALDRELTRACEHGENRCKRRRMDYWDLSIHKLKRNLSIWCQYLRRKRRNLSTAALTTSALNLGLVFDITTEDKIMTTIKKLREEIKEHYKESATKRDAYLLEIANIAEDLDDNQKANALRNIKRQEQQNRAYRSLKFQRGRGMQTQSINRLQVPKSWPTSDSDDIGHLQDPKMVNQKDDNDWREINCPKEIEFMLRMRNQRHFGQAESDKTPFTTEAMKQKFNWNATTNEAELVLEGDYNDEDISITTKMLLDNMTRVTELDELTATVTRKELKGKFLAWRESTSTSPSGRHLGHYKVLFSTIDHRLHEGERTKYRSFQDEIADCYVIMLNYAINYNYSYKRWKQIINMMIYKETGNVKIHRLQVIHIYEADLNLLLGLKWKDSMQKAQKD